MDVLHTSVMGDEVLRYLAPENERGELLIDATLGEGGHSELFLKHHPGLSVIGVDADGVILERARERLAPFGGRVKLEQAWFDEYLASYSEQERPTRVLFDLGISIFHYRASGRGFSFSVDEPLDMRLSPSAEISAAEFIAEAPEARLAEVFFLYGEERFSRRFARAIVARRADRPISTAKELADIIWGASPAQYRHGRLHPATRSFQALRILVNSELERLPRALEHACRVAAIGARIGVISFHSLEDRIVKHFFREISKACICPPELPICKCGGTARFEVLTKKPVYPSDEESRGNPPSRSARLRVLRKLSEPVGRAEVRSG